MTSSVRGVATHFLRETPPRDGLLGLLLIKFIDLAAIARPMGVEIGYDLGSPGAESVGDLGHGELGKPSSAALCFMSLNTGCGQMMSCPSSGMRSVIDNYLVAAQTTSPA